MGNELDQWWVTTARQFEPGVNWWVDLDPFRKQFFLIGAMNVGSGSVGAKFPMSAQFYEARDPDLVGVAVVSVTHWLHGEASPVCY